MSPGCARSPPLVLRPTFSLPVFAYLTQPHIVMSTSAHSPHGIHRRLVLGVVFHSVRGRAGRERRALRLRLECHHRAGGSRGAVTRHVRHVVLRPGRSLLQSRHSVDVCRKFPDRVPNSREHSVFIRGGAYLLNTARSVATRQYEN